jgi:glucokinase
MPKRATRTNKKAPKTKRFCTIGIDLGGTKVACGLVDPTGKLLGEARRATIPAELASQDPRKTEAEPTPSEVREHISYVVEAMADCVVELLEANFGARIDGIGLASAGPMNILKGTLDRPANFKGWKLVPLVKLLSRALARKHIKQTLSFQNDAIAAALGEGWVGRARGCDSYAMVTVGTGIGSGVILNGLPAQAGGMGSEWGHMLVQVDGLSLDRDSFNTRSVEGIASGTGLVRRARANGLACENAHELAALTRAKNPVALKLFAQASEALAALFYNLSLGFHLEKIVISGGMLGVKELFLPAAVELYRDMMLKKNKAFVLPVQVASLGTKAGVIGAARLPYLGR